MNYLQQINEFWEKADDTDTLKGNDIAVYFALLRINNKYGWRESFRADWAEVCQYAHISKNTFYKSLETLQDAGFIRYDKGVRNCLKPKIFVLEFKNRTGTEQEQKGNKTGTEREQKGNLDKQVNKETNKLKTILPFSSDAFIEAWGMWEAHRKEKKSTLTATSIKMQLKKLSEIGEERAIAMLNFTIEKGWTGLREEEKKAQPQQQVYAPPKQTNERYKPLNNQSSNEPYKI